MSISRVGPDGYLAIGNVRTQNDDSLVVRGSDQRTKWLNNDKMSKNRLLVFRDDKDGWEKHSKRIQSLSKTAVGDLVIGVNRRTPTPVEVESFQKWADQTRLTPDPDITDVWIDGDHVLMVNGERIQSMGCLHEIPGDMHGITGTQASRAQLAKVLGAEKQSTIRKYTDHYHEIAKTSEVYIGLEKPLTSLAVHRMLTEREPTWELPMSFDTCVGSLTTGYEDVYQGCVNVDDSGCRIGNGSDTTSQIMLPPVLGMYLKVGGAHRFSVTIPNMTEPGPDMRELTTPELVLKRFEDAMRLVYLACVKHGCVTVEVPEKVPRTATTNVFGGTDITVIEDHETESNSMGTTLRVNLTHTNQYFFGHTVLELFGCALTNPKLLDGKVAPIVTSVGKNIPGLSPDIHVNSSGQALLDPQDVVPIREPTDTLTIYGLDLKDGGKLTPRYDEMRRRVVAMNTWLEDQGIRSGAVRMMCIRAHRSGTHPLITYVVAADAWNKAKKAIKKIDTYVRNNTALTEPYHRAAQFVMLILHHINFDGDWTRSGANPQACSWDTDGRNFVLALAATGMCMCACMTAYVNAMVEEFDLDGTYYSPWIISCLVPGHIFTTIIKRISDNPAATEEKCPWWWVCDGKGVSETLNKSRMRKTTIPFVAIDNGYAGKDPVTGLKLATNSHVSVSVDDEVTDITELRKLLMPPEHLQSNHIAVYSYPKLAHKAHKSECTNNGIVPGKVNDVYTVAELAATNYNPWNQYLSIAAMSVCMSLPVKLEDSLRNNLTYRLIGRMAVDYDKKFKNDVSKKSDVTAVRILYGQRIVVPSVASAAHDFVVSAKYYDDAFDNKNTKPQVPVTTLRGIVKPANVPSSWNLWMYWEHRDDHE
jgi:hypothetical protein